MSGVPTTGDRSPKECEPCRELDDISSPVVCTHSFMHDGGARVVHVCRDCDEFISWVMVGSTNP